MAQVHHKLAIPWVLFALALCTSTVHGESAVVATIHTDQAGEFIAANFLGLSYEAGSLPENHFDAGNVSYVHLLENLGPGVFRIGGNSVEYTYWPAAPAKPPTSPRAIVVPANVDRLFALAKQTHWHVIFGLNLGANLPAMAADEAKYAASIAGDSLMAFEVGNEPDLYSRNGLRGKNYSPADYQREVNAYFTAIRAAVPDARFAGPATAGNLKFFEGVVHDENMTLDTNHFYPFSANPSMTQSNPRFPTIERLLSEEAAKRTLGTIEGFRKAAGDRPLRYAETNSASHGGAGGVSNVFASALWSTDYLFMLAEHGVIGANFHGGFAKPDTHSYSALCIDDQQQFHPLPLYYGMLLFHQAAHGHIVHVDLSGSANIGVHAVLGEDGKLRVVAINKDSRDPAVVRIVPGKKYTQAGVMRLIAPSADARENITLGGNPVQADGDWFPGPAEPLSADGDGYPLKIPAASAAMVTFE